MAIFVNNDSFDSDEEFKYGNEDTGIINEFSKGFGSGVDQLQALGGGAKALAGSALGIDSWFEDGMDYFNEQMDEANENAADVGRIEDIDGVGDLANYSAFIVGNIIPSLIGGGGVGAVGGAVAKNVAINLGARALVKKNAAGVAKNAAQRRYGQSAIDREALGKIGLRGQQAGAAAFGTVMGAGESFTRIFDETGEEAAGLALITGLASGALDAMTPMRVLKRVLPQNLYGKATQEIAESVSKKQSAIGRAFKEAAKASGTEGVTEMMQEVVQSSALEFVRGQSDPRIEEAFIDRLFDEENRSQYLNAFVAGAIGGGAIGGATGAVTRNPELKQNLDEDAPKVETTEGSTETVQEQAQDTSETVEDQPQPEATDQGGAKVQAARAKALDLPTDPETAAEPTQEEMNLDDGIPAIAAEPTQEEMNEFEVYVTEYYSAGGIFDIGATKKEISTAIARYDMKRWGGGDSVDRENVRDLIERGRDSGGGRVQAAREKAQGLPDGRYNVGPMTVEQAGEKDQSLPERRDLEDPETRQAEARAKARSLVDGLPAVRAKVKEIYQMELGNLGETTRIPKEKEPEPVAEEAPEFGGYLPESTTPRMEELVGKDVNYNGNKGLVVKKDDGFYVATQDNGDVLIESGEYQAPEQLGVVPSDGSLEFEPNAQIDGSNKFELRGKKYTLTRIIRDADGKALSLAVRDENGKKRTIRTPEVVARINSQKNPPPDFRQLIVDLDDLPASVQRLIVEKSDPESIPDSVSAAEAIELAETLPNSLSMISGIRDVATQSLTISANALKAFPPVKYTESISRPSVKPLTQAIADINKSQGSNRSPIDEGRINSLFDADTLTLDDGTRLPSIINNDGKDGTAQSDEIKSALVDLLGAGMPKRVLQYFKGLYVHLPTKGEREADGKYIVSQKAISLNKSRISELAADTNDNTSAAALMRFNLAHEIGHAFDLGTNHTLNSPDFSINVNSMNVSGVTFDLGPVIYELGRNFQNGTELGLELGYPFGYAFEWLAETTPDNVGNKVAIIQKEAFAQAFAVFHASPEMLQEQAPLAYKHLKKLLRVQPTETIQDGEVNIRSSETEQQSAEVQGQVRSPTESRSPQVQIQAGAGGDGRSGADAEQAGQGLGGQTQREDGDDTGRPLQLAEDQGSRIDDQTGGDNFDPTNDLDSLDDDVLFAPVSTRFPTAKRSTEDPIANVLVNDYDSFVDNEVMFSKNMLLVKKYNNLTKKQQRLSDKSAADVLIGHVKENLLSIYDAVPEVTRATSKQWYKGANKIVQRMADKHGISLAQASAAAANLSPQKDWYQNASLAERVMDIFHSEQSSSFDGQMKARAEEIYFHKEVSKKGRVSNREMLDFIGDRSLQQLITDDAPAAILGMWIRTWDQTYNDPSYRLVSPAGKFLDYAVNADGKTQSKVAWGSLNEIGKAVSVLLDPSQENVSRSLGSKNKVRNFYNNIFEPDSTDGFVTIDTHAVAAGLLKPLSGDSLEVSHNFGTGKGTSSSSITGHSGTYSIFEEAYRQAAADRGVLAREMQSITWEAVRGLFTSTYKAQDQNVVFVEGVWNQYSKGKLSLDEARTKINEHSGGIQRPDWERSDFTVPDEVSETSYQRKLSDGSLPRQDTRPQEAAGSGAGIDAAGVSTDQLNSPPRRPSDTDFVTAPTSTAAEIMSDEDLIDSVRTGTTSGGGSGVPSNGIKKWLQKNFSSRGLLPETAFDSMIQRDGEFGAVELDIRQMVGIYDNAVVENFGNIDGQQRAVLDDAMKRPAAEIETSSLPRDIKDSLIAMRGYIDSLSIQYATLLNEDIELLKAQGDEAANAKVNLLEVVLNNMGTYANRSYQAFNNKNWNKEIPDEVILSARSFLVEQGTANPDQVINTILKEGTAYDDMASFISESKLGAKDLSILTKRKQIAPEIRALLGEYKDPRVNFANSASKMSRLIYNDKFLKQVLESGKGIFLFDQESAPADATKKIAEVGSKTMSPLNGMYTYPEVEQAFKDALGKEEMGDLYRTIIKVNGLVKYGKTVIAPTTMARNFMSASMFTIANGHFNWSKLSKSAEVSGSYFSGIGDGIEYLKNLKKLGVVHDSPYAGEMIAYLQDANAEGILDQRDPSAILDTKDAALSLGKRVAQGFTKAYQFGDDFWKIVGFENEVMSFMENKGMSREEAEPLAAKRIRDTYPTYSLIGKIPQQLRRFPLVGTFVSFPAEIVRTQVNMIKYLREDLADPDMRPAAIKRITGMAMMSAGVYAAQAMAMSAFGVSEEEEEAIKLMAAPWAKNSNILVTGRDNEGRIEYLDLTHLDPYALMKRPLNALMRDQPIDDALIDASAEILKPFLGWDISTNTILEFISNKKSSGGEVYNDADTFLNKSTDTLEHFAKGMGPSVIQNGIRIAKAMGGEVSKSGKAYDMGDEMGALVGFRKTTFDPKIALHFKAYEFSEGKRQSTRLLTSKFRDPNDVSDSDIREAFGRASTARKETFSDMAALVNAAMKSGISATQAMQILRSNGVTKKDARALVGGGASAWTMSDSTLKNSIAKSDVLFGEQKSQQFRDRWALIQQLLIEEN